MPSHICVVMAVYNRWENVAKALASWAWQTCKDFSLVVADDGSEDDLLNLANIGLYSSLHIQYYRRRYGNVAVMLNKGTVLAPEHTTHIWYTDGDIIFNPQAVDKAYEHIAEYPERVITGRYDWLPNMHMTTADSWERILNCDLPRLPMETGFGGHAVPELPRHVDHRLRNDPQFFDHKLLPSCRPILGANVIIPLDAWYETGGWDEHIPGSNANDCDFGWTLTDAGYELLTCECIRGLHQYHPRDSEKLKEGTAEALRYIFTKHGQEIPERWREK